MKFILGKKKQMTQLFMEDGRTIPVTAVEVAPNVVTQVREQERDGYVAVQVGTTAGSKHVNKAQQGHCKDIQVCSTMREFRVTEGEAPAAAVRGTQFGVEIFRPGDRVQVTGMSKGQGFQGVVKRHNFAGAPATHGTKDQLRMPGSIGATGPAHVFKGRRMPGRMGHDQVTITGLSVVKVDRENNVLYIKGAVPGAFNTLLAIQGPGTFKLVSKDTKTDSASSPQADDVVEEAAEENTDDAPAAEVAEEKAETAEETPAEEKKEEEPKAEEKPAEDAEDPSASSGQEKEESKNEDKEETKE